METDEGLLRVYLLKVFQEMQESDQVNWLQDCARTVARLILRGKEEAIWAARVRLGQCEVSED
jgi:hypothetical protein